MAEHSTELGESTTTVKLAFFDLDGTLVDGMEYIYQHLWEYFGVEKEQTLEVLKKYLQKEISYGDWVKNDVRLLQEAGATKAAILEAIKGLYSMEGAVETIRTLQKRGYKVFVISGGIDLVIEAVFGEEAESLFEEVFINRYLFDKEGNLTGAVPTPYDMEHKATCIKDTATKYGVEVDKCLFVGDNENDIEAALVAGTSIAFNSKSENLVQAATHHVESRRLPDILRFVS
ncbi:MAG: HAD-IB family phosphatase [Patescibacteria group bacterium]